VASKGRYRPSDPRPGPREISKTGRGESAGVVSVRRAKVRVKRSFSFVVNIDLFSPTLPLFRSHLTVCYAFSLYIEHPVYDSDRMTNRQSESSVYRNFFCHRSGTHETERHDRLRSAPVKDLIRWSSNNDSQTRRLRLSFDKLSRKRRLKTNDITKRWTS